MANIFDVSTPAKRFRLVAWWEAVTWAALLVAMFFKWVLGHEEAIRIPGMVHGTAGFLVFIVVALLTAWSLKWDVKTTILALIYRAIRPSAPSSSNAGQCETASSVSCPRSSMRPRATRRSSECCIPLRSFSQLVTNWEP